MRIKASLALAAVAGFGLSACSPMSQTVKSAHSGSSAKYTPPSHQFGQYQQQRHTYVMQNPAAQNMLVRPARRTTGMPDLPAAELRAIGQQIFQNEGAGQATHLVHWNDGENFASLGIGHFTWYPSGRKERFGSTFPDLLRYMESRGAQAPEWLKRDGAPWRTRAELMRFKQTPRGQELQDFLNRTQHLQTQFIVDRTRRAVPRLVKATPGNLRQHVARNLNAVANTPGGWYALIDYTNFKGEGLMRNGGYKGQNWGLLQVLEEMRPSQPGPQALHEFADAAMRVLQRRVRNSPPGRNENRWLAGWSKRVDTYRQMLV